MFGHDRSIMKGTSLDEQSTLSSVSFFPLEGYSWHSNWYSAIMAYNTWKLGCDWSAIINNSVLSLMYLVLNLRYLPETPHPVLCTYAAHNMYVWSLMRGTLLGQQRTFSAVSRLLFDGLSWNTASTTLLRVLQKPYVWSWSVDNEEHFTWRAK